MALVNGWFPYGGLFCGGWRAHDYMIKRGENCVIGAGVLLGEGCVVGNFVVIHEGSVIGVNVRIDDFACIGKRPMKAVTSTVTTDGERTSAMIGDNTIIGTNAVIYRGSSVGSDCLIADFAIVREDVIIGNKTIIGAKAVIENQTTIGSHVKIQTNAYITAYSVVEDCCFIAPCVVTSNDNFAGRSKRRLSQFKGVMVKKGGRIGAGAVILPGKTINEDGFVGAGSVVTKDVPSATVVVGVPARVVSEVDTDQLLGNQV